MVPKPPGRATNPSDSASKRRLRSCIVVTISSADKPACATSASTSCSVITPIT
jgi:hypothetical protein